MWHVQVSDSFTLQVLISKPVVGQPNKDFLNAYYIQGMSNGQGYEYPACKLGLFTQMLTLLYLLCTVIKVHQVSKITVKIKPQQKKHHHFS